MAFRQIDRAACSALLVLPLLVALVYSFTFPGHFFMDDAQIVKANNLVYQLDLKVIFTTDYWGSGLDTGLFRPLTILSFSLNRLIFGIDAWGYLLVNIALHAAVTLVFYLLLTKLGLALECAWLAAALFAVHPVHCEPVIELVGRSELLAALFSLLAIYFSRGTALRADFAALGCFLLALLSKESGVVVLAVVPLIDWFFERDLRKLLVSRYRLYLGMVLLTLLWLAYRHFVIHPDSAGKVIFSPNYVPLPLSIPQPGCWPLSNSRLFTSSISSGPFSCRVFILRRPWFRHRPGCRGKGALPVFYWLPWAAGLSPVGGAGSYGHSSPSATWSASPRPRMSSSRRASSWPTGWPIAPLPGLLPCLPLRSLLFRRCTAVRRSNGG